MTQDVKVPRAESRYTPYRKTPKPKPTKAIPTILNPTISKAKKTFSFSFGPTIPTIQLNRDDPEDNCAVFDNLIKVLQTRKQRGKANKKELTEREDHFRKRLGQINQENVLARSEMRSVKALLKKEKHTTRNLGCKVTNMETANENLALNNHELQDVIRTLQNTVDEKNLRINQNHLEREKAKQKLALQSEKLNQELDEKLRLQRHHLQAAMLAKDAKIQKVKQILESDTVSVSSTEDVRSAPLASARDMIQTETQTDEEVVQSQEAVKPSRTAVVNPRHRRSRSMGEVWLEHNSVKPVALGTVLQPVMKKRKSVSKLKKASDVVNSKQNKYCLIAQEADTVGEVETKLYKADIVPTCGGGAQVIFNDVERLRQESPVTTRAFASPNLK